MGGDSITSYGINTTGNVPPLTNIQGALTTLNQPAGVDILAAAPPGAPVASVPTMTEWGMVIFIVLMALVSLVYLKRGRPTGRKASS